MYNKGVKKESKTTRVLKTIILIQAVAIFLSSALYLFFVFFPSAETPSVDTNPEIIFDDSSKDVDAELIKRIKEMKALNSDFVCWMSIKGTDINYPIVRTNNNSYYLTHNFYKKYDRHGAIFIDYRVEMENSDHWLIHGHSMIDDTMFGKLDKFASKDYYEKHKEIALITEDKKTIFKIIAALKTRIDFEDDKAFKHYEHYNITNESEFNYYVSGAKSHSLYKTDYTPVYGKKLITLSTCMDADSPRRFIVIAAES